MADTYINITVRRADGSKISDDDFMDFKKFFMQNISSKSISTYKPRISADRNYMYGECEMHGYYDRNDMRQFATTHSHLQIEVIVEYKYYDCKTRFLYYGGITEESDEERSFPPPELIDWPWQ